MSSNSKEKFLFTLFAGIIIGRAGNVKSTDGYLSDGSAALNLFFPAMISLGGEPGCSTRRGFCGFTNGFNKLPACRRNPIDALLLA